MESKVYSHSTPLVPFLNLQQQYHKLKPEIDLVVQDLMANASFIKGKTVRNFEQAFASYVGAADCVGVANGTDGLVLVLKALGIGPGDEVITVPNTFIATVESIVAVGATPVLADIDYSTFTIAPESIAEATTTRTKAVIPVHLYGMPCDIDPLVNLADKYNLRLVFDGAQAHGARYKCEPIGKYGDATTFSFYPGKNLGAYGDGGAVVGNDQQLLAYLRMLADHGREDKYLHKYYGCNSRLDAIQAAILQIKLHYLEQWNLRRREIAGIYNTGLASIEEIQIPMIPDYVEPVWHLYVIRTSRRNQLQKYLAEHGIQTGIHYPVPLTHQPAAQGVTAHCDKAKLKQMADQILSLPIDPEMNDEQVAYVVNKVVEFFTAGERQ